MNDPGFIEAARSLAQQAIKASNHDSAKTIDHIARAILCRPLQPNEQPIIQASYTDLQAHYQAHPEDATALISVGESQPDATLDKPTLAAWTMIANELLNLDEVLNK